MIGVCMAAEGELLPWQVNPPIVTVSKEVYRAHERPHEVMMVSVRYAGPELQRREVHAHEIADDVGGEMSALVGLLPRTCQRERG